MSVARFVELKRSSDSFPTKGALDSPIPLLPELASPEEAITVLFCLVVHAKIWFHSEKTHASLKVQQGLALRIARCLYALKPKFHRIAGKSVVSDT